MMDVVFFNFRPWFLLRKFRAVLLLCCSKSPCSTSLQCSSLDRSLLVGNCSLMASHDVFVWILKGFSCWQAGFYENHLSHLFSCFDILQGQAMPCCFRLKLGYPALSKYFCFFPPANPFISAKPYGTNLGVVLAFNMDKWKALYIIIWIVISITYQVLFTFLQNCASL